MTCETAIPSRRFGHAPPGFTRIDALCMIGFIVIAIALLLPTYSLMRIEFRKRSNETQVRGIHQGMVTFSQSSKRGARAPSYPGRDWNKARTITADGPDTFFSGNGSVPAARLAEMLNGNFFTPEYIISPGDPAKVPAKMNAAGEYVRLTADNHSYAMLALPGTENEAAEWEETLNSQAVVLGDRAIGTGPGDVRSLWTRDPGEWNGHIVFNDNSTRFAESTTVRDTQYGNGPMNATDDLFQDDAAADDAFLVHEDATTAYSKR